MASRLSKQQPKLINSEQFTTLHTSMLSQIFKLPRAYNRRLYNGLLIIQYVLMITAGH